MAKVLLFTALILSIVVPFRMYFKGERSKRRYKISLAVNALAFFGLMLGAGLVMFGGNAFAAETAGTAAAAAGTATGLASGSLLVPDSARLNRRAVGTATRRNKLVVLNKIILRLATSTLS